MRRTSDTINVALTDRLGAVRPFYTIKGSEADVAKALESDPDLQELLLEAVGPIRRSFGGEPRLELMAQWTDEDILLRAAIQLPTTFAGATGALDEFDRTWWLGNCGRSGAALVFDYELRDAVRLA